jgi:hypothetical protein
MCNCFAHAEQAQPSLRGMVWRQRRFGGRENRRVDPRCNECAAVLCIDGTARDQQDVDRRGTTKHCAALQIAALLRLMRVLYERETKRIE